MRRILIIGSAGAGKTVLSLQLGELLRLPVVHLDALHWLPGWEKPPRDAWLQIVDELIQRDSWIMDGNYDSTLEPRLEACDTVVLLDLPRALCLYRVLKRSLAHHGRPRPDLNEECREQLPDREFISWIWNYPKRNIPRVRALLQRHEGRKTIFVLKSRRDIRRLVDKMAALHRAVTEVVSRLEDKGLVSIYLCGSLGTPDELPSSDIDLLAIVEDSFDVDEGKLADDYLRTEFSRQTDVKATVARVTLSELAGDSERDQFIPVPLMVKHFPFFRLMWGRKIDPRGIGVEPYSLKSEAIRHIERVRGTTRSVRMHQGVVRMHPAEFAKMILHLAFVEAEVEHGLAFTPSYERLARHLGHRDDHIAHRALAVRKSRDRSAKTFLELCDAAEQYVDDLEKRLAAW